MRLPDFLIIGAQRAGTTWLYKNLREHPEVFMPSKKELEFFSHNSSYARGLHYYERYFEAAPSGAIVGEATPSYLWVGSNGSSWESFPRHFSRETPKRVYRDLGAQTKILVSLRNPIRRAASAMLLHAGYGRVELEEGLLGVGGQAGIVHMGFYALHLAPWVELFGDTMLVLLQEETEVDPERTLQAVYRHVGVDALHSAPRTTERSNRGPEIEWRDDGAWVVDEATSIRIASQPDLQALTEEYAPDVAALSDLLGRDLRSIWPEFQ